MAREGEQIRVGGGEGRPRKMGDSAAAAERGHPSKQAWTFPNAAVTSTGSSRPSDCGLYADGRGSADRKGGGAFV